MGKIFGGSHERLHGRVAKTEETEIPDLSLRSVWGQTYVATKYLVAVGPNGSVLAMRKDDMLDEWIRLKRPEEVTLDNFLPGYLKLLNSVDEAIAAVTLLGDDLWPKT